ncbi:hypothetical protein FPV67DRAFT_1523635, partial [Lyophyllum atratum]
LLLQVFGPNPIWSEPSRNQVKLSETAEDEETAEEKDEETAEDDGTAEEDEPDMAEKMFDWCIADLHVYNGDVVKSDSAVPDSLKEALKAAAAPLEGVPAREKDYHPGSDDKVLGLVHPRSSS